MTTVLKPGTPDLLGISWSQYGGKTGIWRFMKILDETEIKATVCLNAKGGELFPDAVKELHARGHEIAGHSYTQDLILPYLEPEEEKEVIQRCSRIIEKAAGTRPVGWFSPVAAPTVNTAEFLAEEGFFWHGDYNDSDLPYVVTTPKGSLVAPLLIAISRTTGYCVGAPAISTMFTKTRSTFFTNTKGRQ
jgi:peptidoglycan/xylan/chitin deacetylase (PgdA/CDA1 family)